MKPFSAAWRGLPRAVWVLGGVSLLMDLSSEMIHGLLPVFLVAVLGAPRAVVGLIEGLAEATASILKLFSGWLSDRWGRRKPLALFGYGLAAASKPLFALAAGPLWVLVARFADRVGKGVRGAPRDALIADVTPAERRGAAYGLRQSLDTIGAIAGPLVAAALMLASGDDYRLVFWLAAIPGAAAALLLWLAVEEPARPATATPAAAPPSWLGREALAALGRRCWIVVGLAFLLALARYSEAFLLLRAENLGLAPALTPLVLAFMNVVYALSAFPVGHLSDRLGERWTLLGLGVLVSVVANALLALGGGWPALALGVALWGLHLGLTQGLLAGLVADTAPAESRGTAFGLFNLATGAALLPASALAGLLWDAVSPAAPFCAAAALSLAALAALRLATRDR
jgi:MFS family permease